MTEHTSLVFDLFEQAKQEKYGDSLQTIAVRELIADLDTNGEMTPAKRVLAATALSLAENIERGNSKGRAIANEAAQLAALVEQLTAERGTTDDMTPETKALINALTIDATVYARTPPLHETEPEQAEPTRP